ncbi:MAG: YdeI/OmpD-associated family protein [Planctomycetes bacterium]|nr:YdeI/OmpD-associated family protein [Planctomycetota bacterium]
MATRRKAAPKTAGARPRYSPHPGLGATDRERARLLADTGRSFEAWVALARRDGVEKGIDQQSGLRAWLRTEHGVASRRAWWIAATALDGGESDYGNPEPLVDALYSGPHARWRPLHESVIDRFLALGPDVIATACKTMVPVYRKFVFAELRPVRTGVEIHLALGDTEPSDRLTRAPGRNAADRLSRAVVVRSEADLDAELQGWLVAAYAAGNERVERATTEPAQPREFTAALRKSKSARETWEQCTPAMRRDMLQWITEAKQAATREKRLQIAIGKLGEGKRRVY